MFIRYFAIAVVCTAVAQVACAQQSLKQFSSISAIRSVQDKLFVVANDYISGPELWISDGTPTGTRLLKDIYVGGQGSNPASLTVLKDQLFFTAYAPGLQTELWKSDGTAAGTRLVADLAPPDDYYGGSNPNLLTVFKDRLYFTTSQEKLYKTDGTAAGTVVVDDYYYAAYTKPSLTVAGDYLYYYKGSNVLYRTNGSSVSSIPLPTVDSDIFFRSMYAAGDKLFALFASTYYTEATLFAYDAAANTWSALTDINGGGSTEEPTPFMAVDDKLFFIVRKNDVEELWVSNGTPAGTFAVKSFPWTWHISRSGMESLTPYAGLLFFRAGSGDNFALWKSDGTAGGTVKVHDIQITTPSYDPNPPVISDGKLFFSGNNELWKTDGTTAGTGLVYKTDAMPVMLTDAGNVVYFASTNVGSTSMKLWSMVPSPQMEVTLDYSPVADRASFQPWQEVVTGSCLTMKLTVANKGLMELLLSQIVITGADYFIKGPLSESIAPNGKQEFSIALAPVTAGIKESTVAIFANDGDQPTFQFTMRHTVVNRPAGGTCATDLSDYSKIITPTGTTKKLTLSNTHIGERSHAGATVGTLALPGATGAVQYTLVAGTGDSDNASFVIDGNTLKTAVEFDYKTRNVYGIRVKGTSTDNVVQEEYFVLQIVNAPTPASTSAEDCARWYSSMNFGFTDVAINQAGYVFATTTDGRILRSLDEGVSWESLPTGVRNVHLLSIVFKNNVGYAAGTNVLLKSDDGGATWFRVNFPTGFGNSYKNYTVFFVDEFTGYVSNGSGNLIFTEDGGRTWQWRRMGSFNGMMDLYFVDALHGWAIYEYSDGLAKTEDGGITWTTIDLSDLGWLPRFHDMWFKNKNDGFLVSDQGSFRTSDGGLSWTKIPDFWGGSTMAIRFIDDKNGFIYDRWSSWGATLYRTADGGNTWSMVAPLPGPGAVTGVARLGSGKLISCHSVAASNNFNAGRAISISSDDGASWATLSQLPNILFYSVRFPSEKTGYVMSEYGVYKTTDRGMTWNLLPPPFNQPTSFAYFEDENTGYIARGPVLYKTEDGGATFTEAFRSTTDPNTPASVGALYIKDNLMISFNMPYTFRSLDKGKTWKTTKATSWYTYTDAFFISSTVGYRMELFGGIQKTTNAGDTWQNVFMPPSGDHDAFRTLWFFNESVGLKAGDILEKTTDGGVTWKQIYGLQYINQIRFIDAQRGYATGNNGNVYYTVDGGDTWDLWTVLDGGISFLEISRGNVYFSGQYGLLVTNSHDWLTPTLPSYVAGQAKVCPESAVMYTVAENYWSSYEWSVTDGATLDDNGATARVEFPVEGIYQITVKEYNACGISDTRTFDVTATSMADVEILGADVVAPGQKKAPYEITDIESDIRYSWSVTGGSIVENNHADIRVNWSNRYGDGQVSVTAADTVSGCRTFATFPVSISGVTGIETNESTLLSVYPNPTHDEIAVISKLNQPAQLQVYDVVGKKYLHQQLTPNQQQNLSLRNFPAGVYIFKIIGMNDETVATQRVIKH
jgi:ELWxxDGT repeat protein